MSDDKSHILLLLIILLILIKSTKAYASEIKEAKVAQKRPTFISSSDWSTVIKYCKNYGVNPYLIAAIGWHETHWRRLGAGRRGWVLGYGYFAGSTVKEKYRGLEAQLKGACSMISKYFHFPISRNSCINFALNHWKPSAPRSWGKSVYSIYVGIEKGVTPQITPTEVADVSEKLEKVDLMVSFFIAFADKVKEVWGNE